MQTAQGQSRAKAAAKKTASNNETHLRNLRLGFIAVNVATILIRLAYKAILGHPLLPRGLTLRLLNGSALVISVAIYRHFNNIGTPHRDAGGNVIRSGEDLEGQGIIEFAWDTLYITWGCQIFSSLFSTKFWYLWLTAPGIGLYKLYSTFAPMLRSMRGTATPTSASNSNGQAAPDTAQPDEPTSKRQAKLRARMDRGDKRVQQREVRRAQ